MLVGALAASVPAYGVAGGSDVPDGSYGFVAKVAVGTAGAGGQSCTGALIDPQWVITAAACFAVGGQAAAAGKPPLPTKITIGRADLSGTAGQVRTATRLVPHPDRDIVLVKLDQPTTAAAPVALSTTAPTTGEVLRLAGFGRTATEWVPNRLHSAQFTVGAVSGGLADVTGVGADQPGVCKGDAGGPALRETNGVVELVAINHASWQGGCLGSTETRRDATETRVDDISAWIRASAPGGLAQDSRDDVTTVYAYASGAIAPFTFTTGPAGAMTARGGYKSPDAAYNSSKMRVFRGDFNGDEIVDQAVLNSATDGTLTLDTFLAKADGTYSAGLRSWTSKTFGSYDRMLMTSGDFNGDGRTDIAGFYDYSDYSIRLFTWLARADGSFGTPAASWFHAASPYWGEIGRMQIFAGDFNGDGRTDLGSFYGYADGSDGIYTWIANASGGFADPTRPWFAPATPYWGDVVNRLRIVAGDFNGDGYGDVAGFYNYSSGALSMLTFTAKPTGGFNDAFSSWKTTTAAWGSWDTTRFTAGDFNGDGRDDVAALFGATDGTVSLNTLIADDRGGFAAPTKSWSSTTFGSYASMRLAEDNS